MQRQKQNKDASEDISGGKPPELPEGIPKAIKAGRTGPSREVNLLLTEEQKLDDLDLDLLRLTSDCGNLLACLGEEPWVYRGLIRGFPDQTGISC